VASEDDRLHDLLLRRAEDARDAAAETVAQSEVLAHISEDLRGIGMTSRCAWCGRYRIGERWARIEASPLIHASRTTHGICDVCVANLRSAGLSN
jgi:hypothetical protein